MGSTANVNAGDILAMTGSKLKTSATDPLSAELAKYQTRESENAKSESDGNTAAYIDAIRNGKVPEKTGAYNAKALSDASYEYMKYKEAQGFRQRAEARSIAAAGRARRASSGKSGVGNIPLVSSFTPYGGTSAPRVGVDQDDGGFANSVKHAANNVNLTEPDTRSLDFLKPENQGSFNTPMRDITTTDMLSLKLEQEAALKDSYFNNGLPELKNVVGVDIPMNGSDLLTKQIQKGRPIFGDNYNAVEDAQASMQKFNPAIETNEYPAYKVPNNNDWIDLKDGNISLENMIATEEAYAPETARNMLSHAVDPNTTIAPGFEDTNALDQYLSAMKARSSVRDSKIAMHQDDNNRAVIDQLMGGSEEFDITAKTEEPTPTPITDKLSTTPPKTEEEILSNIMEEENTKAEKERERISNLSEDDAVKELYDSIVSTPGTKNISKEIIKYAEANNMKAPTVKEVNALATKIEEMHKKNTAGGSTVKRPTLAEQKNTKETKKKSTLMAESVAEQGKIRDKVATEVKNERSSIRNWAETERNKARVRKDNYIASGVKAKSAAALEKADVKKINDSEKRKLKIQDEKLSRSEKTYTRNTTTNSAVTTQRNKEESAAKDAAKIKNAKSKKEFDALNTENATWKAFKQKMLRANPNMSDKTIARAYTGFDTKGNKIYKPTGEKINKGTKRGKASGYNVLKKYLTKNGMKMDSIDEAMGTSGSEDKLNSAVSRITDGYSRADDNMIIEFLGSPEGKGIVDLNDRLFAWNKKASSVEYKEDAIVEAFDKYASRLKIKKDRVESKKTQTANNKGGAVLPTPK